NAEYFKRIDALNYTMIHDDGQHVEGLEDADVVLVGVSRTSKTPTSIYLANRGVRTANVPLVPGIPLPHQLETLKKPLVVSLHATPERLIQVRQNRLLSMGADTPNDDYIDRQAVTDEVAYARKLSARFSWAQLDVTRRKACFVSSKNPSRYVIGADQTLALGNRLFSKPAGRAQAADQLRLLAGHTHELHSAVAVARDGNILFLDVSLARLTMRALSGAQIRAYLDEAGEAVTSSVGAYQLEGQGVHLFERIQGDHFTISGLPLLPL